MAWPNTGQGMASAMPSLPGLRGVMAGPRKPGLKVPAVKKPTLAVTPQGSRNALVAAMKGC